MIAGGISESAGHTTAQLASRAFVSPTGAAAAPLRATSAAKPGPELASLPAARGANTAMPAHHGTAAAIAADRQSVHGALERQSVHGAAGRKSQSGAAAHWGDEDGQPRRVSVAGGNLQGRSSVAVLDVDAEDADGDTVIESLMGGVRLPCLRLPCLHPSCWRLPCLRLPCLRLPCLRLLFRSGKSCNLAPIEGLATFLHALYLWLCSAFVFVRAFRLLQRRERLKGTARKATVRQMHALWVRRWHRRRAAAPQKLAVTSLRWPASQRRHRLLSGACAWMSAAAPHPHPATRTATAPPAACTAASR